jgi:hypothetical protein
MLANVHHHSGDLVWGVGAIVIGVLHLVFCRSSSA